MDTSAQDRSRFGPTLQCLLDVPRLPELGVGEPDMAFRHDLESLTPETLFGPVRDPKAASACLAGVWLHFDFLDQSHRISQNLDTTSGSYWHGIVHRREGDFANASYWFRRVGDHAILGALGAAAAALLAHESDHPRLERLTRGGPWDPQRFVDICKACASQNLPDEEVCKRIQRLEWDLLFDHCQRQALAGPDLPGTA